MSVDKPVGNAVDPLPAMPVAAVPGEAPFIIDEADAEGVICVTGRGFWTPEETDRHFAALQRVMAHRRAGGHAIRVLVDLRLSGVQSPETAARIAHWTGTIYQPGDRAALIVASSLVKFQMRRIARIEDREVFISPGAARKWLLAYG